MATCAISGVIPEEPVVSKTGYIFEKSLIIKYIEIHGRCPISSEPLTEADLVPLKVAHSGTPGVLSGVKARGTSTTSIPSMLQQFHQEWDALLLDSFNSKIHLDAVRQELAHALYQNDAACRVIARLVKERDAARSALATTQAQLAGVVAEGGNRSESSAMEIEAFMNDEIKQQITDLSKKLSSERKKRVIPATLPTSADLKEFHVISTQPLHKTTEPAVTTVAVHPSPQSNLVVSGGIDKTVVVFDRVQQKKIATLKSHTKKITSAFFHPTEDIILSASHDRTAKIWKHISSNDTYECASTIKAHSAPIVGMALHATNDYIISAASDSTWAFHDIRTSSCLAHVAQQPAQAGSEFTCIGIHPDGLIHGTGSSNNVVSIWDIKGQQNVANFVGHEAPITDISFSESGIYLATSSSDGIVKLWDLRKLKNLHTHDCGRTASVESVTFDPTGTYLATGGGSEVRVLMAKTFELVKTFGDVAAKGSGVNDVAWGADSGFLVVAGQDRNVRFLGRS